MGKLWLRGASWGRWLETKRDVLLLWIVFTATLSIQRYRGWYLSQDPSLVPLVGSLRAFRRAMRVFVLSPNLLQLFLGWELLGASSLILISFWNTRVSARLRGGKRVLVNRIGDILLFFLIRGVWVRRGGLDCWRIPTLLPESFRWLKWCLVGRRRAKSAQLPLHGWLRDAMEGPTPVSALLHAATLVVAGVWLLVRFNVAEEIARELGRITCRRGRILRRFRGDLKRVVAYSTLSQIGYLLVGLRNGRTVGHLVCHRVRKASLFLRIGRVIVRVVGEQDSRQVGGLGRLIPATGLLAIGRLLSLRGLPYLSGWCSKETLLETSWGAAEQAPSARIPSLCLRVTSWYARVLLKKMFSGVGSIKRPSEKIPSKIWRALLLLWLRSLFFGILTRELLLRDELEQPFGASRERILLWMACWAAIAFLPKKPFIISRVIQRIGWCRFLWDPRVFRFLAKRWLFPRWHLLRRRLDRGAVEWAIPQLGWRRLSKGSQILQDSRGLSRGLRLLLGRLRFRFRQAGIG